MRCKPSASVPSDLSVAGAPTIRLLEQQVRSNSPAPGAQEATLLDTRPAVPEQSRVAPLAGYFRWGPMPCSARASCVTGIAVFSGTNPEPRRLAHTLVNSAPNSTIWAE
jgi:hypothetical protein